ncbi:MAG: potassium transporter KtrB [Planctomycetes bacterium]|nr:potassium transporter KtrB [Planctomycetota bacterium]
MNARRFSPHRRLLLWAYRTDPLRVLVLGYLSHLVFGWLALCLPFAQERAGVSPLDHLFTAASAMSTTGLATVSIAGTYNAFGEAVVLLLIQAGGLGYMTLGSFVLLTVSGRLSPLRMRIGAAAWAIPSEFEMRSFVRLILGYTLLVELAGALALYFWVFRGSAVESPVWHAAFHSISSFCTAGLALFDDSFERYRGHGALNAIVITLSVLGAIGFLVVNDLWRTLRQRRLHVTLTSKIILVSTGAILAAGTLLFWLDEPLLRELPANERWLASLFQVMSAATTVGYNSIPISSLSASSLFLITIVMVIGASPAGTGGGLKTTTISALWAVMTSVLRRRSTTTFLGREIPEARLRAATAGAMFYGATLAVGLYAFALVEQAPLADQAFECASALGTVGLSRGITGSLTDAGKWILIALMFAGRVGPLVLGMTFLAPRESEEQLGVGHPEEDLVT